jgi:Fe-S cluster assembly protein SufD
MTAVTEHIEREVAIVPPKDHTPVIRSLDPSDFPTPTSRDEEFRFTPMSKLRDLHKGDVPATGGMAIAVNKVPGAIFELTSPKTADRQGFTDKIAAGAWAKLDAISTLTISADAQLEESVVVSIVGSGAVSYGQLDINVEKFAKAVVIVDHIGDATYAGNIDINVADGGSVTVVSLQDWDAKAVHLAQHRITLGRDSSAKHVLITLGGEVVRVLPSVVYTAPGGQAELFGLYFAGAGQHAEHRLFVDHSEANCRSNVVYKGALDGEDAHTVWVGDVLIRANAVGTDTYEINRNLVLSGGGRADSVPNLEIETGEIVGAGHASTTGRFDDEQLFYLQSRGINEDEARRLVLRGFFEDLLGQIGVPEINDRVRNSIEARLGGHI